MDSPLPDPDIASLVPRATARLIDILVQVGVLELAARCSDWLPVRGLIPLGENALLAFDVTVGVVAMVTYTAVAERLGGATLGKFLTGLKVVDAQTQGPLSLRAAVLRNLALLVDLLVFGLVAQSSMSRSPLRRRVGDHWAGTLVVRRGLTPQRETARGWPVGLVAALAVVVGSYVLA